MREVWLHTNRRALVLGMILPFVLIAVGLAIILAVRASELWWIGWLGYGIAACGLALFLGILLQLKSPRLAYDRGELQVYLRGGAPLCVPIGAVECVMLSAGAGQIPGAKGSRIPLQNLVLHLAEKATDYHRRDVKPALGRWEEGSIVIHGAWCERLTLQVVQNLNRRLSEVQAENSAEPMSAG